MAQHNQDLSVLVGEKQSPIEQLEKRINDIQYQIDDLKTVRDPLRANQRIDLLQQQLSDFGVKIAELGQRLNSYVKEDKYIELFTDDEFKMLYNNSGLGAKDVASLIKANEKFKDLDTSAPAISKIVNGTYGSIYLRNYLAKQFRFAIKQRENI